MNTQATGAAALLTGLLIVGYVHAEPASPSPDLPGEYERFIYALETKATSTALQHLSQRHAIELGADAPWADFKNSLPVISVLDRILPMPRTSFESFQHNTACLTVNGDDPGNEPTSIHVEFIQENSTWKMDYVQVVYHESEDDLPTAAVCPQRLP